MTLRGNPVEYINPRGLDTGHAVASFLDRTVKKKKNPTTQATQ